MKNKAREVYEAACGIDVWGDSRALVKVQAGFIDRDKLEEIEEDHLDMNGPVVEIHQNARLTLVSLIFDDCHDSDFMYLSDMIKTFQTMDNSIDDNKMPGLSVTIMPKELEGSFIYGVSGIALFQASRPGNDFDTVSFVFTNDCIHAYMLHLDRMDADLIGSDAYIEEQKDA